MKTKLLIVFTALGLCGCGAAASSGGSNSNALTSNRTSSASPSPSASSMPDPEPGKALPPATMEISEFMMAYDKANEGRIVTVTGGQLEDISYGTLLIREPSDYAFSCSGNFSDYMAQKTRIDDLRYKHQSPTATVKGIYTNGTSGHPSLRDCVLMDLKR